MNRGRYWFPLLCLYQYKVTRTLKGTCFCDSFVSLSLFILFYFYLFCYVLEDTVSTTSGGLSGRVWELQTCEAQWLLEF